MAQTTLRSSGCPRVLVVEDTVEVRDLLVEILESEGYHVEASGNGQEALARLQNEAFDVVLLDLMMPVMDGLALLEQLRHESGSGPPVIVMSAFERFRRDASDLGARAFIGKPIDIDHLLEVIQRHVATSPPQALY